VGEWIDLLDPSPDELAARLPEGLHESDLTQLHAPGPAGRPGLTSHDGHVFGVLLVAVVDAPANDVFYQEIDVVLTMGTLLTVRKTTPGRPPYDSTSVRAARRPEDSPARCVYRLVDDVADHYLDVVDDLEQEIGDLEDHVVEWSSGEVTLRIRRLRHQILHVRRTLGPMRDTIRAVADGRIDLVYGMEEQDPRDLEHEFSGVHDRLLRATEGLELAHDLLAGARDYYQAKVAQDQNEVVKRLTAIASLLLVPTFIVGLYGQNFLKMPEYHWGVWGYVWSWGLIVASTIGQLWYFRRKQWL
jgi:magnesium transporter